MTTSTSTAQLPAESTEMVIPPSSLRTPRWLKDPRDYEIHALSATVNEELAKPEGGLPPMPPRWWEQFDHPDAHRRDWERRSTG